MGEFTITKGDSCYVTVNLLDEQDIVIPFVTGDKVIFSAKKNLKQTTYDIQSELATNDEGTMIIILSPTDTDIPLGDYYYDIQYTTSSNDVYTLSKGKLTVEWEVTE